MTNKQDELLPCRCGKIPKVVTRDVEPQNDHWYGKKMETFVLCDCGICLFDGSFHEGFADEESAVAAWKTRPTKSDTPSNEGEAVPVYFCHEQITGTSWGNTWIECDKARFDTVPEHHRRVLYESPPSQPVDTKLLILALDLLHSDMKKVNRDYDVEHLIHQVLAIKSNINGMFAYSEQHTKEVKRLEESWLLISKLPKEDMVVLAWSTRHGPELLATHIYHEAFQPDATLLQRTYLDDLKTYTHFMLIKEPAALSHKKIKASSMYAMLGVEISARAKR